MAEVIVTDHVIYRLLERKIDVHEAKRIAKTGKIEGRDYRGRIIRNGKCADGRTLEVVSVKEASRIIIITAYYEN